MGEPAGHLRFQGQVARDRVLVNIGRRRPSSDYQVGLVLAEGGQNGHTAVGLVGDFNEAQSLVLVDSDEPVPSPLEGEVLAVIGHEDVPRFLIHVVDGDVLVEGEVAAIVPVDIGIVFCN